MVGGGVHLVPVGIFSNKLKNQVGRIQRAIRNAVLIDREGNDRRVVFPVIPYPIRKNRNTDFGFGNRHSPVVRSALDFMGGPTYASSYIGFSTEAISISLLKINFIVNSWEALGEERIGIEDAERRSGAEGCVKAGIAVGDEKFRFRRLIDVVVEGNSQGRGFILQNVCLFIGFVDLAEISKRIS